MANDPFNPDDITDEERHAKALARNDLSMLSQLVRRRQALGMTQEDVARAIGRDKSAVSRFERLDSDPRLSTVRRYARAVGANVDHHVTEYGVEIATDKPIWNDVEVDWLPPRPMRTTSHPHMEVKRYGDDVHVFLLHSATAWDDAEITSTDEVANPWTSVALSHASK